MAIQFNPKALSMFSNVDFGNDNAIANLGGDNNLVQKKKLGSVFLRMFRLPSTEARNNAVRTELLKALGQAFNLDGVTEHGGKTMFSNHFMDRLSEILGPDFNRGDFGIKNGVVDSGKPLTQRRIKAIFNAAATAKADATAYDGKTYLAKLDAITDWFRNGRPQDDNSTAIGLAYFGNIKRTIDFLESDMAGFDEADDYVRFVFNKTGMRVDVKKIRAELQERGVIKPEPEVINLDNLESVRNNIRIPLKTEIRKMLEELVKKSVDLMFRAKEARQTDELADVFANGSYFVEKTLAGLDRFSEENTALTLFAQ